MERIWAQLRVRGWLLAVLVLMLALASWLVLRPAPNAQAPQPGSAAAGAAATGRHDAAGAALPGAPSAAAGAVGTGAGLAQPGMPASPLQDLQARQAEVSRAAAAGLVPPGAPGAQAPGAAPAAPDGAPARDNEAQQRRMARLQALREIQAKTMAELAAVPPGDNKRLYEVLARFDSQLRAAGVPPILEMDKLRKVFDGADRIQDLNRQLLAEAQKGKAADPARLRDLSSQLSAIQTQIPRQFIRADVMEKAMAK